MGAQRMASQQQHHESQLQLAEEEGNAVWSKKKIAAWNVERWAKIGIQIKMSRLRNDVDLAYFHFLMSPSMVQQPSSRPRYLVQRRKRTFCCPLAFFTEFESNLIHDSRSIAVSELLSSERRKSEYDEFNQAYSQFMAEYLAQDHMEIVSPDELVNQCFYMLHHAVSKRFEEDQGRVLVIVRLLMISSYQVLKDKRTFHMR